MANSEVYVTYYLQLITTNNRKINTESAKTCVF